MENNFNYVEVSELIHNYTIKYNEVEKESTEVIQMIQDYYMNV